MGAQGKTYETPITAEYILAITQGGWDVFVKILGRFPISRAFRHPLKRDRAPSASVFCREGIWFLKDFAGTFPTMTAIGLVQRRYSLNYKQAIEKICNDLGISQSTREYKPVGIIEKAPEYVESEIHIGFSERKWTKKHHEFWENTEVDEPHCIKYNTFAVKEAAINRRRVKIGETEVVWAYFVPSLDKVKLYFPERPKGQKFRGNVPSTHIWNIENISKCRKLLVQKSMKDLLCTTVIFPCVVGVPNESAALFNSALADRVNGLADKIWLAFGSDKHGVEQSTILSREHSFGWVNPPNFLLQEDINDAYSLEKKYGVESWRECLKNKGVV